MPIDGGYTAQDVEWIDAIRIIDIAYNKVQQEAEREAEEASKSRANSGRRR
jgi:hypothetical protein